MTLCASSNAALRYRPAGEEGARPGGAGGGSGGGRGGGGGRAATPGIARAAQVEGTPAAPGVEPARKGARRGRVYRLQEGKPAPVDVQIGISDGRQTEVISGLSEGDEVIVGRRRPPAGNAPQGGPRRGIF